MNVTATDKRRIKFKPIPKIIIFLQKWWSKPRPWGLSRDLWLAIFTTVVIVSFAFFLGWANNKTTIVATYPSNHYVLEPNNPLSYMASWDGADYIQIAKSGYQSEFWVSWFPLYPVLIASLGIIIPSLLISALLISWASMIGAVYFFIKIIRKIFKVTDSLEPLRAVVFFVLFPTAIFFVAPFTESLDALLSLGAIYFALNKRYLSAGILAAFASANHVTGILVALIVGMILIEEKVKISKVIISVVIGSIGLISYSLFLYLNYHNPLAFLTSQITYHNWTQHDHVSLIGSTTVFNLINFALVVAAVIYWWNRRRSFAIYSALFLLIPLAGRQWGGFDRYCLMVFPIGFMLYDYLKTRQTLYAVTVGLFICGWTYLLLQYAAGYIGS
jgi:Gpi18-like mannosyltransferase